MCLCVCAISKHPISGVGETSGQRMYSKYLPAMTQLKKKGDHTEAFGSLFEIAKNLQFWISLLWIMGELAGEGPPLVFEHY